jgi:hypothetical protein
MIRMSKPVAEGLPYLEYTWIYIRSNSRQHYERNTI